MTNVRRGRVYREKRQAAANARIGAGSPEPQRQLELLDARLGVGVGAIKERARLAAQLNPKKKRARKGEK